jgi:hypothetical protein
MEHAMNSKHLVVLTGYLVLVVADGRPVAAQEIESAVRATIQEVGGATPASAVELSALVRRQWDAKSEDDWIAIKQAMADARLRSVHQTVIEVASDAELDLLVAEAATWVDTGVEERRSVLNPHGSLGAAHNFIYMLEKSGRWNAVKGSSHWVELLEGTISGSYNVVGGIFRRETSVELWVQTPMTAPARERSALSIIERMQRDDAPHEVANAVISEPGRERLRRLLMEGQTLQTFHKGAASALAELGDRPTLAILEALAPQISGRAYQDETIPRPRGPMGVIVEPYVRRISVQADPNHLLRFIATHGEGDLNIYHLQAWAVGRAVRMGIDRVRVRAAVVTYLEAASAAAGDRHIMCLIRDAAAQEGLIADDEFENLKRPEMPRIP